MEDVWGFIWIMVVLKVPLLGLLFLVWYAVRLAPDLDDEPSPDDGGSKRPHHPRSPRSRHRPRGPHGDPAAHPPPPRVRTVLRGRQVEHDG